MAFPTIDNASLINPSELPSPLGYGAVQNLHFSKSITTTMLGAGYITAIALMPANTRYLALNYAKLTDIDTNGSPAHTLNLGIAGVSSTAYDDVDAFLAVSTIGQAGTSSNAMVYAGLGLLVPIPHYITFGTGTAAATAAAGTFTLGLAVELGASA